jgi:O6-methylguanine-DNA--protein-cysteine methyltransferase
VRPLPELTVEQAASAQAVFDKYPEVKGVGFKGGVHIETPKESQVATQQRANFAAQLRALAEVVEQTPDVFYDVLDTIRHNIEHDAEGPFKAAAVWNAWNALPEGEPSPVKRIANEIGMNYAEVAEIVYPNPPFGAWHSNQEPDLALQS